MSSATFQPRGGFRPKLLALSVAACFSLSSTQSLANPTGGSVSSGSAGFASSGNTLTVTNSASAIINWQSFSIGVNEITRFVQSSASSAVLNRVVGSNGVIPQSVIDGVLSSNGRVFLINQSGILFGANARIDVAGLVASSLNLSDQDFLNGRMRFTETPGAGGVSNAGLIDTTSGGAGGRVFLVGPDVQNSGVIRSPQGEIVLAAGKSVELVYENSPFVTVHLVADAEQALNVGQLISDSGRIGMFGALVRQGGVAEASSAVLGANGDIRLVATKDLTLDPGSRTTANGASGGNVLLQAQGGTNLISGTVEAKGSSGQGGTIQALGVRVGVIGAGVIDASGDAGGGTVLVGGDAHGANPNVQNAQQTLIGPDGIIRADAGTTGDGGRVIVWSDDYTRFFGTISARGGSRSGNGGFVETSGATLQAFGSVDTSAPNGKGGNWLLDPDFINIIAGTAGDPLNCLTAGVCSILFVDLPIPTSQISVGTIDTGLRSNGSVILQARQDITLLTDLTLPVGLTVPGTFTAQAGNNIILGGFNITAGGTNINLIANDAASGAPSGKGSITSALGYGNITTGGGSVNLAGFSVAVGNINTSGGTLGAGSVTIGNTSQPITSDIATGAITTASATAGFRGGSVSLVTQSGNITVNGAIDTRGATGSYGNFNGSNGGSVTLQRTDLTVLGSVKVNGDIVTSGGDGVVDQSSGQGGSGGFAGDVTIGSTTVVPCTFIDCSPTVVPTLLSGDILVAGSIIARGGNGAGSNANVSLATANNGGSGGFGGSVSVLAIGKVAVGGTNAGVDVSGGAGGGGSAGTSTIPSGIGGAGGSGGSADLEGGTTVAVGGSILANGGAGGKGGDGTTTILGGTGGLGGLGGEVLFFGGISASATGALSAIGGAGGVGGAYGGAGGVGGLGGFVLAAATGGSIAPTIDVSGGAGGAGGVGNNFPGGIGGAGGNSGSVFVVGDIIDLSKGGVITAAGGSGGAGGVGVSVGGNGGNGGNGGLIELTYGSTFLFTAPLNASVSGGAGGAGGVTGGLAGAKGLDGTILISMLVFSVPPLPEVTLASNAPIAELAKATGGNPVATGIDELVKKNNDSKQKKDVAVCN
jgi:filamentous hemagglutinin family protein